jgi:hypothetical protein
MPDASAPSSALPSKAGVFVRRLVSTVVLWTVILVALFCGNALISDYVFLTVMVLLAVAGLAEFYGMVERRDLVCFKGWGILGGLLSACVCASSCPGATPPGSSPSLPPCLA